MKPPARGRRQSADAHQEFERLRMIRIRDSPTGSRFLRSDRVWFSLYTSILLMGFLFMSTGLIMWVLIRSLRGQDLSLNSGTPDAERLELLVRSRTIELLQDYSYLAVAAIVLASVFIAWFASGALTDALRRISGKVGEITSTDLSLRLDEPGNDEFALMAASLDDLLEQLEVSFESRQQMMTDTSEQLEVRIARITEQLELLDTHNQRSGDTYRQALDRIGVEVGEMSTLVDRALETARQEMASNESRTMT